MQTGHDPTIVARQFLWLGRAEGATPMKLLKLVYIGHGWMLGMAGRPLVNEPVEAWPYGPVVPSVYHAYKAYRGNRIEEPPLDQAPRFESEERDVMQQVWSLYRGYTGIELSNITHQPGTPWAITKARFGVGAVIPDELIEDHYRRLALTPEQKQT